MSSEAARKRLLILSFTSALSDPRVNRQASFLSKDFDVHIASLPPEFGAFRLYPVEKTGHGPFWKAFWALSLLAGFSGPFLKRYRLKPEARAAMPSFDLVLVNDADPLPLAFELAQGAPVFFDAHEYYPREFDESLLWRLLFSRHYQKLCERFLKRCAGVSTVCDGLADEYFKEFGVRPVVVRNAPRGERLDPSPTGDSFKMIHHGAAIPGRLRGLIEMMAFADERFSLDFMLVGKPGDIAGLKRLAAGNGRIRFIPPVPMPEISSFINRYDLGVYLLPPDSFNNEHALPNKFFEFVQASLGVVIGPSPEMAALVRRHKLGAVAEDFSPRSLAKVLNSLDKAAVEEFKRNSHEAAALYNAEAEMERFIPVLKAVASGAPS